jgi:WD40 repeat protein
VEYTIKSSATNSEGWWIFAGCREQDVKIWNADCGEEILSIQNRNNDGAFVLSPDGRQLIMKNGHISMKPCITTWDIRENRELGSFEWRGDKCAVSPDGKRIASGTVHYKTFDDLEYLIEIVDLGTGEILHTLAAHKDRITTLAYSPDGRLIVSGSADTTIILWDANCGKMLKQIHAHNGPVTIIAVSPDGKTIASAAGDSYHHTDVSLVLWDVETGKRRMILSRDEHLFETIVFSPDGAFILAGSVNRITEWESASGHKKRSISLDDDWPVSIAFSPDGKRFVSAVSLGESKITDIEIGKPIFTLSDEKSSSAIFSPDGAKVAVADASGVYFLKSGEVVVYEMEHGREILRLTGHESNINSIAFNHDGHYIVTGSDDYTIRVWDGDRGEKLMTLSGHRAAVMSAIFSPDGKYIVSGSGDHTIIVWDVESGRKLLILSGHNGKVNSIAFHPGGRRFLSASDDKTIRVWDIENPEDGFKKRELHIFSVHTDIISSALWSPDGNRIYFSGGSKDGADCSDAFIGILGWTDDGFSESREVRWPSEHTGPITSIALSRDGSRLLSASADRTVKLMDTRDGRELRTFSRFWIDSLAIAPEERRILVHSWKKTMQAWHDKKNYRRYNRK